MSRRLSCAGSATERQIDALVYELYALTGEEIGIVDGRGMRGMNGGYVKLLPRSISQLILRNKE